MELKRDPKIREELKKDICDIMRKWEYNPETISEEIILGLEKLGWHGVKE